MADAGWRPYRSDGKKPHEDHVHVSLYDKGGRLCGGSVVTNTSGKPEHIRRQGD